jgi:hypothetical protein
MTEEKINVENIFINQYIEQAVGVLIQQIKDDEDSGTISQTQANLVKTVKKYDKNMGDVVSSYICNQEVEQNEADLIRGTILKGSMSSYMALQELEGKNPLEYEQAKELVDDWIQNQGYIDSSDEFEISYGKLVDDISQLGIELEQITEEVLKNTKFSDHQKDTLRDMLVSGSEESFADFYNAGNVATSQYGLNSIEDKLMDE